MGYANNDEWTEAVWASGLERFGLAPKGGDVEPTGASFSRQNAHFLGLLRRTEGHVSQDATSVLQLLGY